MKKFYALVSLEEKPDGFAVLLDGRPIKTPEKSDMLAPNQALAKAIRDEWSAQGEDILPDTMPLTQILSTKIDRVSRQRAAMTDMLLKYIDTDLVCYFAAQPPDLITAQEASWRPVLDWFAKQFGAELVITNGLVALYQSDALKQTVETHIRAMDDDIFTLFQLVAGLAGSVALGLMFTARAIDAQTLFAAIRIEERHNAAIANEDIHGPDPAQATSDAATQQDLTAAEKYLLCLN